MKTNKLDIATELLHTALRLYFEGGSDFATINLAGAADDLLGKHLEEHGDKPMSGARDESVAFDPLLQARDLLDRAITNYYNLMDRYDLAETELVRRYNTELATR